MKKVYIVMGETGEHSDSSTWIAKISLNEEKAKEFMERLNSICEIGQANLNKTRDTQRMFELVSHIQKELQTLDPEARVDYTGASYLLEIHDLEE